MFDANESAERIFTAADSCSVDDLRGPIRDEVDRVRREMRTACLSEIDKEIAVAEKIERLSWPERAAVKQFLGYAKKHILELP